jgi:lipopolysaccharide assembly outer membrane protein LptD (OstA)
MFYFYNVRTPVHSCFGLAYIKKCTDIRLLLQDLSPFNHNIEEEEKKEYKSKNEIRFLYTIVSPQFIYNLDSFLLRS